MVLSANRVVAVKVGWNLRLKQDYNGLSWRTLSLW